MFGCASRMSLLVQAACKAILTTPMIRPQSAAALCFSPNILETRVFGNGSGGLFGAGLLLLKLSYPIEPQGELPGKCLA